MKIMDAEYKCKRCGKKCIDNYPLLNEYNKRTWCNECIDILWKERKEKDAKV